MKVSSSFKGVAEASKNEPIRLARVAAVIAVACVMAAICLFGCSSSNSGAPASSAGNTGSPNPMEGRSFTVESDATVVSCSRDIDQRATMGEDQTTLSGEFTLGKELQVEQPYLLAASGSNSGNSRIYFFTSKEAYERGDNPLEVADIDPQDKNYVQQYFLVCFQEGVYAVIGGADIVCSPINLDYPFSENTKLFFGKTGDGTSLIVGTDIAPGDYIVMGINTGTNIIFNDTHTARGFDQVDLNFGDKKTVTFQEGNELSFAGAVYVTPVE